ncbi:hypothetical protein [Ruegeria atlantica]|uniref:hypothetical protein n=1 Tax=Ruegeria atlantica TaxID=81569 RepID=UPI00147CC427|nr:hypothetical protein [Ruegeria atlantica]
MSNSDAILTAARAHFDKMRGQTIQIPEWGEEGKPLVAYYDPPTLRKRQEINQRCGKSESLQMALTCILCLNDKDGKPLLPDDAETLAVFLGGSDPKVVSRVALKILGLTPAAKLGN